MSALVSILIPAFNVGKFLRRCLDSVVNQTHRRLQVVIVDDGSTDDTFDICKEYELMYNYVEVYHQENAGVAFTRNKLLSKVKGDYTLFVDADDWIEPKMVSDLLWYIERYNLDIAVCDCIRECCDSETTVEIKQEVPVIEDRVTIIKKFIIHKDLNGALWNKLIKTELLNGINFSPQIWYGEDALFIWQVIQSVNRVGTVRAQYYHYRMNDSSISHQKFGFKEMTGHLVWKRIYSDTSRLWPEYGSLARASFAVSDMWLIFFAAACGYKYDENIKQYQHNVRDNIGLIYAHRLLNVKKIVFATVSAYSYTIARMLSKLI